MQRILSSLAVSAACLVSLSACSTTPPAATLMTGISTADAAKVFPDGQLRADTDPVCVNFYNNARTFIAQANKPSAGNDFLTSLGVSVLSGLALGGIGASGINSTVGQIAVQHAAGTAINKGSYIALDGLKKNSAGSAKVTAAAAELNCPLNLT